MSKKLLIDSFANIEYETFDYLTDNNGAAIENLGTATLSSATFKNNSATNNAGAIYNWENSKASISDSTFYGNSADNNGGAISNTGTLKIYSSTFGSNNALKMGGAIFNNGQLTVSDILLETKSDTIYNFSDKTNIGILNIAGVINFGLNSGTGIMLTNSAQSTINFDITNLTMDTSIPWLDWSRVDNNGKISVSSAKKKTGGVYTLASNTENLRDGVKVDNSLYNIFKVNYGSTLTITAWEKQASQSTINTDKSFNYAAWENFRIEGSSDNGGAMEILSSGVVGITNSLFCNNISLDRNSRGGFAGAIFNGGSVNIDSSSFISNTAAQEGGAIFSQNSAKISISNSTFYQNYAFKDSTNEYQAGGGLQNNGFAEIKSSTFSTNTSSWAGGAISNSSKALIISSSFSNNYAIYGGAIYNDDRGNSTISTSNFKDNTAGSGGAINNHGNIQIENSTFSINCVGNCGGAIYNSGTSTVSEVTFLSNSAYRAGVICNDSSASIAIISSYFINNSALYNSTPTAGYYSSVGGAIYNEGIVTITNSTFNSNVAIDGQYVTGSYYDSDGGSIYNQGSVVINNSIFNDNHADDEGGAIYNLGYYYEKAELQISNSTFSLNHANSKGGAICTCVERDGHGEVNIDSSTFKGNSATSSGGAIQNNYSSVTVDNSFFDGNKSYDGGAICNLSSITITNSNFINSKANHGGAICNQGFAIISKSTFSANKAVSSGGGAIFGSGQIKNSTFSTNSASEGGAILATGTNTISNSIFSHNNAYIGGALILENSSTIQGSSFSSNFAKNIAGAIKNSGTSTIIDSQFVNNSSGMDGGAIWNWKSATIKDSVFTGNSVQNNGSAIFNSGTMRVFNSTFSDNSAGNAGGAIYNIGKLTLSNISLKTPNDTIYNFNENENYGVITIAGSIDFGEKAESPIMLINAAKSTINFDITNLTQDTIIPWLDWSRVDNHGKISVSSSQKKAGGIYTLASNAGGLNDKITFYGDYYNIFRANYGEDLTITAWERQSDYGYIDTAKSFDYAAWDKFWNTRHDGGALKIQTQGTATLTNSLFSNNTAYYNYKGGAIYNNGSAAIQNSIIINNTANTGGAIYNNDTAKLNIQDSTFSGNNSQKDCGTIFNQGTSHIEGATFCHNIAKQGAGGASYNDSKSILNISSSKFSDNTAGYDGGAILNQGTSTINYSDFTGNYCDFNGGAIYNVRQSILDINNSNFRSNCGKKIGGAIFNEGIININDSSFNDNISIYGQGGAIFNTGKATISNSTFSRNLAKNDSTGGAISNSGTLIITNSFFKGNSTLEIDKDESIYNGGAINNEGIATVSNSTFSCNTASHKGGAIYNNNILTLKDITLETASDTIYNFHDYYKVVTLNIAGSVNFGANSGSNIMLINTWGATLNFDLTDFNAPNDTPFISDWSRVNNEGTISITVNNNPVAGTYKLAGNAAKWKRTNLKVKNATTEIGSLNLTSSRFEVNDFTYILQLNNAQELIFTIVDGDIIPPTAPSVSADITELTNKDVTITATFSNDSIKKEYSTDGITWFNYIDNVKITNNCTIKFRGIDDAGNISEIVSYEVNNIDKIAPVIPNVTWNKLPTNGNVTVNATFSSDSAIKQYRIDNGDWINYVENIIMSENGIIEFRGIDSVGNISETTKYAITNIDRIAPEAPSANWNKLPTNGNVMVSAVFSEDSIKRLYRIGNGEWLDYYKPVEMSDNGQIEFRGIDEAGNNSAIASYEINNIDRIAPEAPQASANITEATRDKVVVNAKFSADSVRKEYALNNGEWLSYKSGIEFTSNGVVSFRGIDAAGNFSKVVSYKVNNIDNVAPEIPVATWNQLPTNSDVTVNATFSSDSAIKQYRIDNGDWVDYVESIIMSENGTIEFRSIDALGNISKIAKYAITNIDRIAPNTPSAIWDKAPTNVNVAITAVFSDDSSIKQYRINSGEWTAYVNGVTMTDNGTVEFRGTDAAGNISDIASYEVTNIDRTAPEVPTAAWNKALTNQNVVVSATFSQDSATKQYRINSGEWTAYVNGVTMTDNGTVEFRGTDAAGNISDIASYEVTNIDKIAPNAPTANWNQASTNQNVVVSAIFSEDSATKEFRIGSGDWTTYGDGVEMTANGKVEFRGIDAAGNISNIASYEVTNIDKVTPNAPKVGADITAPTRQKVTVTANFSEDSVKKEYSLNNGEWLTYTSGIEFTVNGAISFRGIDAAGNISDVVNYEVNNILPAIPEKPANNDIDGNGKSDVLFQYTGGDNQLGFWMNGSAIWAGGNPPEPKEWEVLGSYDMNSNGTADVVMLGNVVVNGVQGAYVGYRKDGDMTTWENISYLNNPFNINWKLKVGNVTGNKNKNSLIWHAPELGAVGVWIDGTSNWKSIDDGFDENWTLLGSGDFTGDGKDEILFQYQDGFYTVDIDGKFNTLAHTGLGWEFRAVGDFYHDGKDDIVFFHNETGSVMMYQDGTTFKNMGQLDAKDWFIVGAGDYNGDKQDDLLVRQYSTGMLGYYQSGDMSKWVEMGRGVDMNWTVIA